MHLFGFFECRQQPCEARTFRFIPKNFTLRNYVAVFTEEPVMLWFKNSMTLAVVTVAISLAAAIPAAYAFSRMRFKGRKPILKQLVLLYSFPSVLSMFAIYTLLRAGTDQQQSWLDSDLYRNDG